MVWQHDKVNRLMDHQTNVGGGRKEIKEEKRKESLPADNKRQEARQHDKHRWIVLIYGEVGHDQQIVFFLSAWRNGDLIQLVSRRSVSDDARHDCYRWQDTDTSQSLAGVSGVYLRCSASTTFSSSCMCNTSISIDPQSHHTGFQIGWGSKYQVPIIK